MARIWLADYECRPRYDEDALPSVCMVCGEFATDTLHRTFRWYPRWVLVLILCGVPGMLVLLVIVLSTTKTMPADCPVCDEHRGHWWKGNLLAALLVVGGFTSVIGGVVTAAALDQPGQSGVPSAVAGIGGLVALLVGLVAGVVVSSRLVRPVEITRDEVHLANVSEGFVEAVKANRRAARERGDDRGGGRDED